MTITQIINPSGQPTSARAVAAPYAPYGLHSMGISGGDVTIGPVAHATSYSAVTIGTGARVRRFVLREHDFDLPVGQRVRAMAVDRGPFSLFASPVLPSSTYEPSGFEAGLRFSASMPGAISGMRFYKHANEPISQTVSLWDALSQTLLARKTQDVTGNDWQTILFDNSVPILTNREHVMAFYATAYYHSDRIIWPRVSGPLIGLSSTRGDIRGGFPSRYYAWTYGVDVIFQMTPDQPLWMEGLVMAFEHGVDDTLSLVSDRASGAGTYNDWVLKDIYRFVVRESNADFQVGTRVRAAVSGTSDQWIEGTVTEFDRETNMLVVTADHVSGEGTSFHWTLNPIGERGWKGATGEQGAKGDIGDSSAPQGPQGPQGPIGPQGPDGPKGDPATLAVGDVQTVAGHIAAVSNSGTAHAAVLDFSVPTDGPTGPQGPKGDTGVPLVPLSDLVWRDGTQPFTGQVNGVAPGATGDDDVLTTASWVRSQLASHDGTVSGLALVSALDAYARLDGASFTGPVEFSLDDTPVVAANGTKHPLWHSGIPFKQQASPHGYIQLPNGLMIQWGLTDWNVAGTNDAWLPFHTTFPKLIYTLIFTVVYPETSGGVLFAAAASHIDASRFAYRPRYTTGAATFVGNTAVQVHWCAIGK